MNRSLPLFIALGLGAALLGCGPERPADRQPGSALWLSPESKALDVQTVPRLADVGVGEYFVPAGTLRWSGSTPTLEPVEGVAAPSRSVAATLVVDGAWPPGEIEVEEVASGLSTSLARLRLAAADTRYLVRGLHFDLSIADATGAKSLARVLRDLRSTFDVPIEFSVRWPVRAEPEGGWADLAKAVDFFVAPLYGQRPGVRDDPEAWSLEITDRLEALDAVGRPYLVEIVTLGFATFHSTSGAPGDTVTLGDVQSLAWNHDLEVGHGLALDRGIRQIYDFEVRAATSAAFRRLVPGESVRVVGTSTPILADLLRRIESSRAQQYRGVLYYRAPGGGEEFGLGLEQVLNAYQGGDATKPLLDIDVDIVHRGGSRWALTLTLRNDSPEPTELSVLDANWVQVQVDSAFVNWVRPGHFPRYQTFQTGSDGELYVALRHADTFRLYVPLVRGHDELVAGPIEVRGWRDGTPRLKVGGAFITPYGGTLELPPEDWVDRHSPDAEASAEPGPT